LEIASGEIREQNDKSINSICKQCSKILSIASSLITFEPRISS